VLVFDVFIERADGSDIAGLRTRSFNDSTSNRVPDLLEAG